MDSHWDLTRWHSSLLGGGFPKPANLAALSQEAKDVTAKLKNLSRDPELWLYRANLMKQLGFAELAVGDAYKAKILVDAMQSTLHHTYDGELALLTWGMRRWLQDQKSVDLASTWKDETRIGHRLQSLRKQLHLSVLTMLSDSLYMATCFWDCMTVAKEGLKNFPSDTELSSILTDARDMMDRKFRLPRATGTSEAQHRSMVRGGQVAVIPYPWMKQNQLSRDVELMIGLSESLQRKAPACQLRLSGSGRVKRINDSWGVFATKRIRKGEVILEDPATVSASTSPRSCLVCSTLVTETGKSTLQCCGARFCSKQCADKAVQTSHTTLCGRDLSHVEKPSDSLATDQMLSQLALAKMLAYLIHNKIADPLAAGIVGHLHPHYLTGYLPISLETSYILPCKTLEALGVDVFSDSRFDFWVIHHINCRFINNAYQVSFDEAICSTMNEHQTLFNHSCEPNCVKKTAAKDMSTLVYTANRDIKEGEELCSSYDDDEYFLRASVQERQEMLRPWFSEGCWCERCKREWRKVSEGA